MAAKSTSYANSLLQLIFNGTEIVNVAQNDAYPLTSLYVSLHTATPGAGGTQQTNEAAYGSYTRVAVNRTSGGWAVINNSVSPVSPVIFPAATGGSETETFFGIGTDATGDGTLLYFGPISPTIQVSSSVTPELVSFISET